MSWRKRKIKALETLLEQNIEELNKGLESGRILHPNQTNLKESMKVKLYFSYLENINNLKKRIEQI